MAGYVCDSSPHSTPQCLYSGKDLFVLFVLRRKCVIVVIIVARRAIPWVYAMFVHRHHHFHATAGSNVQHLFEQLSFDCPNGTTLSPSAAPHILTEPRSETHKVVRGRQGCDVSVQSSPMVRHVKTRITCSPPLRFIAVCPFPFRVA